MAKNSEESLNVLLSVTAEGYRKCTFSKNTRLPALWRGMLLRPESGTLVSGTIEFALAQNAKRLCVVQLRGTLACCASFHDCMDTIYNSSDHLGSVYHYKGRLAWLFREAI